MSPNLGTALETSRDTATLNKRVHQIMSRKPIVLQAAAPVHDAIDIFTQHRISCIPIVDAAFTPVGIITWRDIIKFLATHQTLSDFDDVMTEHADARLRSNATAFDS